MFKFVDEMIAFQEVPDEISLSFSISNCPHHCEGCHSAYLAEDTGIPLLDVLKEKIEKNKEYITCVLFLGGDDDKQIDKLKQALKIVKSFNLKTALYSGEDRFTGDIELRSLLDYIKIGSFKKELGGLACKTTNQRMYKKNKDGNFDDITHRFWKK